jgi:hypothetical protein
VELVVPLNRTAGAIQRRSMDLMTVELAKQPTPEDEELARKSEELVALTAKLAQRELDLIAVVDELRTFQLRYMREVGVRYAELDEALAQLAERRSRDLPHNVDLKADAADARARAKDSRETAGSNGGADKIVAHPVPDDLKRLFLDAAKLVHPDLGTNDADRARRTLWMVGVNDAYERRDAARLRSIIAEFQASPESVVGDGSGAELVRCIRRIAQVRRRLDAIEAELAEMTASSLFDLKSRVEQCEAEGRDLLDEMAAEIDAKIARVRVEAA